MVRLSQLPLQPTHNSHHHQQLAYRPIHCSIVLTPSPHDALTLHAMDLLLPDLLQVGQALVRGLKTFLEAREAVRSSKLPVPDVLEVSTLAAHFHAHRDGASTMSPYPASDRDEASDGGYVTSPDSLLSIYHWSFSIDQFS